MKEARNLDKKIIFLDEVDDFRIEKKSNSNKSLHSFYPSILFGVEIIL